eukprot:UN00525
MRQVFKDNNFWFPIKTLMTFKRLRDLTTDAAVVVAALADSEQVQVNEDKTNISAKDREALIKFLATDGLNTNARTLYVSGFDKSSTMDEIQALLKKNKVPFAAVRLQKIQKKDGTQFFTGDCFIEFKTEDQAKEALTANYGEGVVAKTYEDHVMEKEKRRAELEAEKQKKLQAELLKQEQQQQNLQRFNPTPDFVEDMLVEFTDVPSGTARETFRDLVWQIAAKATGKTITKEEVKETGVDPLNGTDYELEWISFTRDATQGCYKFTKAKATPKIVKALNAEAKSLFTGEQVPKFAIMKGENAKAQWDIIESEKESMLQRQGQGKGGQKRKFHNFKNSKKGDWKNKKSRH